MYLCNEPKRTGPLLICMSQTRNQLRHGFINDSVHTYILSFWILSTTCNVFTIHDAALVSLSVVWYQDWNCRDPHNSQSWILSTVGFSTYFKQICSASHSTLEAVTLLLLLAALSCGASQGWNDKPFHQGSSFSLCIFFLLIRPPPSCKTWTTGTVFLHQCKPWLLLFNSAEFDLFCSVAPYYYWRGG